jgi:hypothetical protein|tara:strand:+ start:102 stop:332 length:231 start_codon:yes stop_codon:yes gene_type:complete
MKNHKGEDYVTMEDFNQIGKDRDNLKYMPNQKLHQQISFLKSGIRIVGYFFIPFSLVTATALLILSEVIGIIEELV